MDAADVPRLMPTLRDGGLFIVPLAALVGALFIGYSATMVAVVGIASVIVVAMMRRKTRLGPLSLASALILACRRMVPVAAACAAAGLVVGGISMTGLSGKVSILILGTGRRRHGDVPDPGGGAGDPSRDGHAHAERLHHGSGAYRTVPDRPRSHAADGAHVPAVLRGAVGVDAPGRGGRLRRLVLAEANPLAIAGRAVLLALPAFIIPFIFAFRPELLGEGEAGQIALAAVSAAIGVAAVAVAVAGYLDRPLSWLARLGALAGGLLLMIPGLATDIAGLVLAAAIIVTGVVRRRASTLNRAESPDES
ncbi:MAG: hypothetical protein M5U09_26905 [Gammaproteobacteria bacterium]|nr:hypothetical protein [Gammaproteobacteria bacterium]